MNHDDLKDNDISKPFKIMIRECKDDRERFDSIATALTGMFCMLDIILKYLPAEAEAEIENFMKSIDRSYLKVIK